MDINKDSDFWKERGNNYYKTGNYIDAIICYKRAIEVNPESDKAWYNLGMAYNRMNNKKESRSCFDKAQELSGNVRPVTPESGSPEGRGKPEIITILSKSPGKTRTAGADEAADQTDWHALLYPGEWSIRFVIVGLLASAYENPVFVFIYYTCAVAAVVAMVFLLAGLVKHAAKRRAARTPVPVPTTASPPWSTTSALSTSSMNIRTWIIFFLICFVALLWAVFLNNQGLMLWVGFALVMIVAGFNLLFVFKH